MAKIIIPMVDQAPELDRNLSQDVWEQASWQGGFTVFGDTQATAADPQTSFSIVHDGRNLYIAVKAEEPHLGKVRAIAPDDPQVDSDIFGQDLFELFLDAEALDQSCAQITFNSRGALVDLWLRGVYDDTWGAVEVFHDWHSKTRISTGSGTGFWWAQLCVPLDRLKFSPQSSEWKFNLVRTRVVEVADGKTEQSISSFAHVVTRPGGVYYNPQFFRRAQVENLDFSRFLWNAESVGSFAISDEGNGLTVRQPLRISNLSMQDRRAEIRCTLKVNDKPEGQTWLITGDFAPSEKREEILEMPVDSEYFGNLKITLTDLALSELVFSHLYAMEREELSWKEHWVRQGDGRGGCICHPASFRFMPLFRSNVVTPMGLAEMDNGEIIFAGACAAFSHQAVVAFSRDRGATWSEYELIEGLKDRPNLIAYLGNGTLTCVGTGVPYRYYSHDYGRTWPERVPIQPAPNGGGFYSEGNLMVDRDASGTARRIGEIGFNF